MAKPEFPIIIGKSVKNKTEVIVVSINAFKGRTFIDARVHFQDKEDPDRLIPTKKGITLNMNSFEPTMRLFLDAFAKLQELDTTPVSQSSGDDETEVPEV
jgi:hypothetical protein